MEIFHRIVTGLLFLDESGAFQQTALRILHPHHTQRSLSSQSDGRHRIDDGLELRFHHLRREQLRHKGKCLVVMTCFRFIEHIVLDTGDHRKVTVQLVLSLLYYR